MIKSAEELPQEVLQFLDSSIDSVEQLFVLLLLFGTPERTWSVSEITAELRSVDTSISKRLDDLYLRNVLVRKTELKERHLFNPSSESVAKRFAS